MIEHERSVPKTAKSVNKLDEGIDCHSASSSWPRGELLREELESIVGDDGRDFRRAAARPSMQCSCRTARKPKSAFRKSKEPDPEDESLTSVL